MRQLDFFTAATPEPIAPTVHTNHARGATLEEQFEAFHDANPHVYQALRKLAVGMVRRGQRRIGIKMLFEVLRWSYAMTTADAASDFRLNNNYAPSTPACSWTTSPSWPAPLKPVRKPGSLPR